MDEVAANLLAKVAGLFVVAVAVFVWFLVTTPGIELAAVFGSGPLGVALGAVAVVLGVAGYVALEVGTGEAFAD